MNVFLKFLKSEVPFLILVSVYPRNSDLLREIRHVFIIGMYLKKKNGTDSSSRMNPIYIHKYTFCIRVMCRFWEGFHAFFFLIKKRPGYQQSPQIYIKKSDNSISAIIILFILPIYN